MRTIIAGHRDYTDYVTLLVAIAELPWTITRVVSGHAKGVDQMGERWANEMGIPCDVFPADWTKYGKSAGPRRNAQMADNAEACLLLYDGSGKGTRSMKMIAEAKGLRLHVHGVRGYKWGKT